VIKTLKGITNLSLDGSKIEVKITNSGDYNSSSSIFVSNLNENVKEKDLIDHFK